MSLRKQAFAALKWTSASMIGRSAIQFGQVIVMSRLLQPHDFGVMSMALAVVAIAQIVSDVGLSNAIIHFEDIDERQLSTLFWLNVLVGGFLTLSVACAAPLVAGFYHEPRLASVVALISLMFVIQAIGQQLKVRAEKKLAFERLAIIELASTAIGSAVAILSAVMGQGVFSLVFGQVLAVSLASASYWIFVSNGWRPQLFIGLKGVDKFLRYGAHMMGINIVNAITVQADVFIAGKSFGGVVLGTYSMPRDLCLRIMMVINPVITRVSFPLLSKAKDDPQKVSNIYLRTIRMTTSVNFIIYAMIFALSPHIVAFLFGERWVGSVPLLRLLALWCAVRSIANPIGSLLYALGRTRMALANSAMVLCILIPSLLFGSKWNVQGMIMANVIVYTALVPIFWKFFIMPASGVSFARYHLEILPPAVAAVTAGAVALLASRPFTPGLVGIVVGGAAGAVAYLVGTLIVNRQFAYVLADFSGLQIFRRTEDLKAELRDF